MRRIYKPNNVTTSEKYYVLGDTDSPMAAGAEPQASSDSLEEDQEASIEILDQPGSESAGGPESSTPNSVRHAGRATVQDVVQLEQLRDQIIAQATSEAARLIEEGHAKAQAEYREAIARAAAQIEHDRQAACVQGRQEAVAQTTKDISNCIQNIEKAIARLESAQAAFITGHEQDLKWMALEIAQKILMDTINADDTRLVPLVMAAVNSVGNAPWMSVEISEHMTGLLTQLQQKLKDNPSAGRVNIRLIDAPPDTCIVETPDKFFDASITQQIENLKGYFAAEQG